MLEDVEQMKKKVKEHFTVTHEIGCMASFIVRTRPEVPTQGDKIKEEAQAALDKCEKDEVETEEKVNQWKKNNRKWRQRKGKGGSLHWRGEFWGGQKPVWWKSSVII